jgi:hypothetical protein
MKKLYIKIFMVIITTFLVLSILIMIAVNLWLTNEKSWVWRIVNLKQINADIKEYWEKTIESSWMTLTWVIVNKKEVQREIKLKFCKKEVLSAIDNTINFALESNIDILFSHTEQLVWDIKSHLIYCLNSNKEGNYQFSKLRENILKDIDPKFIDNIVSDVYNYESYNYIRNFFETSVTKQYFNKVIVDLWDVTTDELKSVIMIEQIRWTMTNRWFFKQMVKHNILQSFTDFSLWISWMKITTAIEIEKYLKDPNSEFYLWKKYETILDYNPTNKKMSLQKKLTENNTYYYQYLYTWIAIKMIKKQRREVWYDLTDKVWLIATIYNIWLKKSNPNDYPGIWGSILNLDWKKWYFWELWEKIWISLQRYKG